MKFIHISDVYLGIQPETNDDWAGKRAKEIEDTFIQVLQACNERDVDLLLIAGNLFAKSPEVADFEWLDEKLQTLTKTRTIIVPGHADYLEADSEAASYRFRSRTVLLPAGRTTNAYLRGINTCVTGFGYAKPEYKGRILEGIEPGRAGAINILIGSAGDKNHMPFDKEVVARKAFDYVALGHYHRPIHILKNRIAYSGSPEPVLHTDQGRHGYIFGEITDDGTNISFTPIAKRSYVTIEVTLRTDITAETVKENLEEQLMKMGQDNIYTIVFRGFAQNEYLPDLTRIKNRFDVYDVVDLTITKADEELLLAENQNNIMGRFIKEMHDSVNIDEKIRNKALRYGMEALIMAGDKK